MTGVRRHVRSPSATRRGGGPSLTTFFFWTFFLVSAAITYLWVYNQNDVMAAYLVDKRSLIVELENDNRELQVIIDKLSQIDRITHLARAELGMVAPAAESLIVYLEVVTP
ncbi:MAG: cell division protein FtsL [Candidatus Marinimicrobia bacterium]|nr:cell division protein FtsL [Candidatus Neomarinimicrobiota bacterium]